MAVITRPVESGQQLFISYGPLFSTTPRRERREKVQGFNCKCDACENNYPTDEYLQDAPVPVPQLLQSFVNFRKSHLKINFNILRRLCKAILDDLCLYVQKIDKHLPCTGWSQYTSTLLFCLMIVYEKDDEIFMHISLPEGE